MTRPTPEERAEIDAVVRDHRTPRGAPPRRFHVHVRFDEDGVTYAVRMDPRTHRRNEACRAECTDCGERLTATEHDDGFTTCGPCSADRRESQWTVGR